MQEVSLHDGVTPVAPHEAGGNVHQVRQLSSTKALGLEGYLPQVEVATAWPVLQVDLQTEMEGVKIRDDGDGIAVMDGLMGTCFCAWCS